MSAIPTSTAVFSWSWGIFPPELYLRILEMLTPPDDTARGALAILNIASTSRSHYCLASHWANEFASNLIQKIRLLEERGDIPKQGNNSRTCLAILCKRAGGICAVCNNRYIHFEPRTKLQVCDGCEAFYFPKISVQRMRQLYEATEIGLEMMKDKECRTCFVRALKYSHSGEVGSALGEQTFGPLFLWADIQELIVKQYIVEKQDPNPGSWEQGPCYTGEEYGYFCAPNEKAVREPCHWPHTFIWGRACARWDLRLSPERRLTLSPCMVDMLLFREFRYQFDRSWSPKRSLQTELDEYSQSARFWIDSSHWEMRPWRLCNFPHPPQCVITTPSTSESKLSKSWQHFTSYQTQCAKIRAVLKTFPLILRSPEGWGRCMSATESKDEMRVLSSTDLSWKESDHPPIEFLLFRLNVESEDVHCMDLKGRCIIDALDCLSGVSRIDKVVRHSSSVEIFSYA